MTHFVRDPASGGLTFAEILHHDPPRKALDGGAVNGHYWVFSAATTDVEYVLRVTDTATGAIQRYRNPLGRAAPAVTDTAAFASCP